MIEMQMMVKISIVGTYGNISLVKLLGETGGPGKEIYLSDVVSTKQLLVWGSNLDLTGL